MGINLVSGLLVFSCSGFVHLSQGFQRLFRQPVDGLLAHPAVLLYDQDPLPEEPALLSMAEGPRYYLVRGYLLELVVVEVDEVLEGPGLHPVEGLGGDPVGVPEVGLVAEVVLEACSAVGAGVVGLGLSVGLSVEEAFVGGSAVLGVEGALASGLAADV
jgi:hypothetical protein